MTKSKSNQSAKQKQNIKNAQDAIKKAVTAPVARATQQAVEKTLAKRVVAPERPQQVVLALETIANSIAAPGEGPVYRWASAFSTKPTAVAKPFEITSPSFGYTIGSYPQVGPSESVGFQFRDPLRTLVVYDQNPAGFAKQYNLYINGGAGAVPALTSTLLIDPYMRRYFPTAYALGSGSYQPHGSILYCGAIEGNNGRYVWCDDGDVLTLGYNVDTTTNLIVGVDYYGPRGYNAAKQESAVLAAVSHTRATVVIKSAAAGSAGYYAPYIANTGVLVGNLVTVDAVITGTGSTMMHRPLPNLYQNMLAVSGTRILGESLMWTNTAPMLNLGGQATMFQSSLGAQWQDYISSSNTFANFSKVQDSKTFNASQGIYGFMKPVQPSDFDLKQYLNFDSSGVLTDSFFPLDAESSFLALCVSIPSSTGNAGYYTARYSIEYLTEDTWRATEFATIDAQTWTSSLDMLKRVEQFHENPKHLKELWEGIKKGVRFVSTNVMKYGPMLLKGAEMIGSLLA